MNAVCKMPRDSEATSLARQAGLNIATVSWEDNGRTKGSCWGPCISDMTLSVQTHAMPLIKNTSNFNDETWDVEIERIPLVVGNHNGSALKTITLKEYLSDLRSYLHAPNKWAGTNSSLLIDGKDRHVICSAQACFLPIAASGESKFNVVIRNYQSSPGNPAILAIVASANGTSAQVLESRSNVHLFHNNNGQRASYIGQRLSDFRVESGTEVESDAPMSDSEKSQNMLLVIQVPLKHKEPVSRKCKKTVKSKADCKDRSRSSSRGEVDVEAAIIKVGEDEGPFSEINDIEMERDERFPIRVTMQYYKATSNGLIDLSVAQSIAEELQGARKLAVAISSLVTETTNRTTEHQIEMPPATYANLKPVPAALA